MKPCLGCNRPTTGSRCPACALPRAAHRESYNDVLYRRFRAKVIRTGPPCHLCGLPGSDTLDHLIPLARGGPNHPTNWAPAHRSCNSTKGAK